MTKVINTTNIWFFILTFIVISAVALGLTTIDKKNRINSHLQNATHTFSTQYNIVYNSYKNMSNTAHSIIFDSPLITQILLESLSNDPKVINNAREKLYNLLKNKYKKLQKLGFEQLHFHTKESKSFLRMHRPEKFGDDLTNIRYSVKYVNQQKKYIHGLEAGRIVHGFRFVYPMFYEEKFLGSVEFSISSNAFISALEKAFDTHVHFIVNKDLIYSKLFEKHKDRYHESVESTDYLTLEENMKNSTSHITKSIIREEIGKDIKKNIKEEKMFSLYFKNDNEYIVSTFLPLKNIKDKKNVAYLISYSKNDHIKKIFNDYTKINLILELVIFLFLYFIYQLNKNKQKLIEDQKLISENSKLDSMREMIGNIAHHWRQPLSVISTTASSLKVQHELNILKEEYLDKSLNNIVKTTKSLSKTIDDFRDYIMSENQISTFTIPDLLKKVFAISNSSIDNNYITLIKHMNFNKEVTSIESTLVESLIKILNNSIEALQKVENQDDRLIFLNIDKNKNNLLITVKDTGGGVADDLIDHIFEPYFTTKHQTVGTGLGLYTVRSNIVNILHGSIEVKNSTFEYKNKNYTGALFTISIKV